MKLAKALILVGIVLAPALGMAGDETPPDMEMLEFLGGFETARGKPLDPLALTNYAPAKKDKQAQDAAKKENKRVKKPARQDQKDQNDEK
jgi:hypothetical protein